MTPEPTIDAYKQALRASGFMVRMTEWLEGFQCAAFLRVDVRNHHVTPWFEFELDAWCDLYTEIKKRGLVK